MLPGVGRLGVAVVLVALAVVGALVLVDLGAVVVSAATAPDSACTAATTPAAGPPARLVTAADYLAMGDFEFDRADCAAAIAAYDRAVDLDPAFAAAYNNRAYTRMRQGEYALALPDLDRAIALRPDYANALMNRGDIYNYYYAIDRRRAIADYDRVVALGPETARRSGVCGHRLMALSDGHLLLSFIQLFARRDAAGC